MSEANELRSMADLLRSGATLTSLSCPACASPLFKMRSGELWCARCKKRVVVVKEDGEIAEAVATPLLEALESTLIRKIEELNEKIRGENEIGQLQRLGEVLSTMLESLERVRRMKKRGKT